MMHFINKRSLFFALLSMGLLVWFFGAPKKEPTKEIVHPEKSLFPVVVKHSKAMLEQRFLQETGRTQASHAADLQARTKGVVAKILVKEGDYVEANKVLLHICEEDRHEKLKSAKALEKEKEARYKASLKLSERKYRSTIDVAADLAEWQRAQALSKMAAIDLEYTTIKAPFAGIIKKIFVEKGEVLPLSTLEPAIQMVALDPLYVVIHVNERDHDKLFYGQEVDLSWVGRDNRKGKVIYISPVADPNNHTFEIKISLDNKDHKIPAGLTTTVSLPVQKEMAHSIEPGSLILSDEGKQGVRVVDNQNRVHFYPVEILSSSSNKISVYGLADTASIITVGQGFVRDGDQVIPSVQNE